MECVEKDQFAFDKIDSSGSQLLETDSKYDKEAANYATRRILRKK